MVNKIKLFVNENPKAIEIAEKVKDEFNKKGFTITEDEFDLGIAIGGDGSFLRMVNENNFDSDVYYVGINAGTLGFMQEVKPDSVNELIDELLEEKYIIDKIGIQETTIKTDTEEESFYNLNEILVRDENFRVINVDVNIENDLLEKYTGDALLIATSYGSTAHNLSYGGSIVYPNFSTLQITSVGPVNSKAYRTLPNSIIVPSNKEIKLIPNTKHRDYIVTVDGKNKVYNDVQTISTTIKDKCINVLRFSHYNFPQKINEKLLSN